MHGRAILWLALPIVALVLALVPALRLYHRLQPDARGAIVVRFRLESRLLGRSLQEILVEPKGGGVGRPLLVLLHGRSSSPGSWLSQSFYDAYAALGRRAPDVLLVNGGDHSYYHDRADGPWGSYVLEEAIPAGLARSGADGKRTAIGGISMGGFGAFDLALHHPGRFCAVGGEGVALWRAGGETPAGAFDDAEDFARNDVLRLAAARARPLGSAPVWIDVGESDPFASADAELARALTAHGQRVAFSSGPGGHSSSYWNPRLPGFLRFYAEALADCSRR